jgi:AcrR family transcriptional regulator
MPRIVDHEDRRKQVALAARELILDRGIDKVTVRDIAARVGFSTAVVSHYFHNKQELMLLVFQDTQHQAEARFRDAIMAGLPVIECLITLLPQDRPSAKMWEIWFAFWGMTISCDAFREEQVFQARKTVALLTDLLKDRHANVLSIEGAKNAAQSIFALLTGIATQATHDPENWSAVRQRQLLESALSRIIA